MAELLVLAKAGYTNPDPEENRRGCFKKGDIVFVAEDGHTWGMKEGPPDFVIVKVPGVTRAAAEQYRDHWNIDPIFSVLSSDLATDTFTIEISNNLPGAANQAALTRAQVEAYLTRWGAVVGAVTLNSVSFVVKIFDALISSGFWGVDVSAAVFTEQSYDQASGLHTIRANYSGTSWKPAAVTKQVTQRGGTVVSASGRNITFSMDRTAVRQVFQDDVDAAVRGVFKQRRWSFAAADVDAALGAGGSVTQTPAQVTAKLIDAATQ